MNTPIPTAIIMGSPKDYADKLKEKIAATQKLTDALFEYLTIDARSALASIEKTSPAMDDLNQLNYLQERIEQVRANKETIEERFAEMEKGMEIPGMSSFVAMMRSVLHDPLVQEFNDLQAQISDVQKRLEQKEAA